MGLDLLPVAGAFTAGLFTLIYQLHRLRFFRHVHDKSGPQATVSVIRAMKGKPDPPGDGAQQPPGATVPGCEPSAEEPEGPATGRPDLSDRVIGWIFRRQRGDG